MVECSKTNCKTRLHEIDLDICARFCSVNWLELKSRILYKDPQATVCDSKTISVGSECVRANLPNLPSRLHLWAELQSSCPPRGTFPVRVFDFGEAEPTYWIEDDEKTSLLDA